MMVNLIAVVSTFLWGFSLAQFRMAVFDKTTDQIGTFYKYPTEVHKVQTKDGYILTMHRLAQKSEKPPVLLMHGLMDSSVTWLLAGPGKSLGFMLFDQGYDVWMGNFRGNFYSREHAYLPTSSQKFWDFSWDEMGRFDVPAFIDHILQVTGRDQLLHIGHSMGTTTFYVMASTLPEYNEKVLAHISYSPIGFWSHTNSAFWRSTVPIEKAFYEFYLKSKNGAILMNDEANTLKTFCFLNSGTARTCKMLLHLAAGFNDNLDDPTVFSVYLNHVGSGSSIKTVIHYTQLVKSGRFREFDYYNVKKNKAHYGVSKPRDYNITNISAPVFFFYGANDVIASPIDIYKLYRMLPNPIGIQKIEDPDFNHLDFTMGPTAANLVYKKTIKIMDKYSNSSQALLWRQNRVLRKTPEIVEKLESSPKLPSPTKSSPEAPKKTPLKMTRGLNSRRMRGRKFSFKLT
nr:PREDICTED: lipase 3-like [Bemisia tabaci]